MAVTTIGRRTATTSWRRRLVHTVRRSTYTQLPDRSRNRSHRSPSLTNHRASLRYPRILLETLSEPSARAATTGPRQASPDPPLQGSNGRTNGRCLTLQVRDGIRWVLSGSVHDPKYEEGHSQRHSQEHSQKRSQRRVSGEFFGGDFTADLTGNLTGAGQRPLLAVREIRPPHPHHGL